MKHHRPLRVGALILEELSKILLREVESRGELITITSVDVDKKLEHAIVYVSVLVPASPSSQGGPPPRGEPRPLGGPASSSSQGGFSRPGQDRPRFSGDRSLRREGAAGDLRKAIGNILQKQQTEQEKKPPQGGEPRQSGGPPASASDKE